MPVNCRLSLLICCLGLFLMPSHSAFAHRLNVFAMGVGNAVEGDAYFSGGLYVENAKVRLSHNDKVISETQTDAQGHFRATVSQRADIQVVVDVGDGHLATYLVRAGEFSQELPFAGSQTPDAKAPETSGADFAQSTGGLEKLIAQQLHPLRAQIQRLENKNGLRDILGGLGYIIGIFGAFAWYRAHKERSKT